MLAAAAAVGVAVGVPIVLATRSSTPAERSATQDVCRHLAQLDAAEAHYQTVVDEGGTFLGAADLDELRGLAAELQAAANQLDGDAAALTRIELPTVADRVGRLATEVHRQADALNTLTNTRAPDVAGARTELSRVTSCK
jgi:hypothetical protein